MFVIEVPLRAFFENPTVAGLAGRLEVIGQEKCLDITAIAQTILKLYQFSEEEVGALLAERGEQW